MKIWEAESKTKLWALGENIDFSDTRDYKVFPMTLEEKYKNLATIFTCLNCGKTKMTFACYHKKFCNRACYFKYHSSQPSPRKGKEYPKSYPQIDPIDKIGATMIKWKQ